MRFGVLCGVPKSECLGAVKILTNTFNKHVDVKVHGNNLEAFKCHEKYLISQGYIKVGNREYKSPEDGRIRVLTKKSHFGGMLRSGKSETTARGGRGMPKKRTSGMIVSC